MNAPDPNMVYIPVRGSHLRYYHRIPLYCQTAPAVFHLYKPAGHSITEEQLRAEIFPRLYLHRKDRLEAIREAQKGLRREILSEIARGDIGGIKETLCHLVAETLAEPRAGTLQSLPETVDILVHSYSKHPGILRAIATISNKDYTTAIHSVNVMALTMNFCFRTGMNTEEARQLGLSALLHDIGKAQIPSAILQAPRRLTPEEFEAMKNHPLIGERLLRTINRLGAEIALAAMEHHEKLDGSGYPKGLQEISFSGRLIGIVDCYEALTNEDRPYRSAKSPIDTLKVIQEDVKAGKYDRGLFEKFCYSLT
jgi:HD-GYP domain-containing protein (c-di-GMP phosphodiesterase class II)